MESISKRDEPPLQILLEVDIFDNWGMDFMGPFPSSFSNLYILLALDYVSKWVEAIPTRTNNARVVAKLFCSHIFTWFDTLSALITEMGVLTSATRLLIAYWENTMFDIVHHSHLSTH